jgi:hypothetical protein
MSRVIYEVLEVWVRERAMFECIPPLYTIDLTLSCASLKYLMSVGHVWHIGGLRTYIPPEQSTPSWSLNFTHSGFRRLL